MRAAWSPYPHPQRVGPALLGAACVIVLLAGGAPLEADEPSTTRHVTGAADPTGTISADEFISSPFAEFFKSSDYPQALEALDALAMRYPGDPLILRYRAIVLDRLGRYDEALALYDQLLAREPNHTPTRFFRAQTYERQGAREKAIAEWQWVKANSASAEYRAWSNEELQRIGAQTTLARARKKFYLFGNMGWEYDSNVTLESNDPGLQTNADQNASRLAMNLGLGYRPIQRQGQRVDFTYTTRQSLHDDSLNEFNFTSQELAADLRKRVRWLGQETTLGARYEVAGGFLNGDLFSVTNELRLSADARLTPQTRSYLYQRLTVADFGPDGSNPPQTSRDGFGYDLGLTQYVYSADFRRYIFVSEEFNLDKTRGANFDRRGTTTRFGLHLPVPYVQRTDFDTSAGFRWAEYTRFVSLSASDREERLDNNWDYYVAVTHRFTPRVSLKTFYRFVNANNKNDFYQYDRHITGAQLLFTKYF